MLKRSASSPFLLATIIMTAIFAGGCTGEAIKSESSITTAMTGSTSKDPSPSLTEIRSFPPAPEGEDSEKAAIRQGWEQYNLVYDKYTKDPNLTDFTEAQQVTTGFWSSGIMQYIRSLRKENLRAEGDTTYRDVKIGDPETNSDGVRVAVVTACLDPTHQYTVDITTGEKSEKTLKGTLVETMTMELGLDKKWRVADYTNEMKQC